MYYFSSMKNALGKQENLKLYNDKGNLVYEFYKGTNGLWNEYTYNDQGKRLTYKNSAGYGSETTYDDNGNELNFKDSEGYCHEKTYNSQGLIITFKNSRGDWYELTYDDKGNELTYKNSSGASRGFDIPEYTMEELTVMIGNFKIKK